MKSNRRQKKRERKVGKRDYHRKTNHAAGRKAFEDFEDPSGKGNATPILRKP